MIAFNDGNNENTDNIIGAFISRMLEMNEIYIWEKDFKVSKVPAAYQHQLQVGFNFRLKAFILKKVDTYQESGKMEYRPQYGGFSQELFSIQQYNCRGLGFVPSESVYE